MPTFRYQGRDAEGRFVEGTWDASGDSLAREELQKQGLSLLLLEEIGGPPQAPADVQGWDLGVSAKALARFTRQLGAMLGAGLPLLRALDAVSRRSAGPSLRRAVVRIAQQLQEGVKFSQALAAQPEIFDELYVSMVGVGEATGDLPAAMNRLATLLERDLSARRRIGVAMAYPLIVLGVTAILTWGMATFMMPIFEPIFRDGGLNLERDFPMTWLLLKLGHLGGSPYFMAVLLLVGAAGWWALRAFGAGTGGRRVLDRLKLKLPVLSNLLRLSLMGRFSQALAALTRGGISIVQALPGAGQATGNRVLADVTRELARKLGEGQRLSLLMASQPIFDPVLVDMVDVGEQSGTLPEMLEKAADYFDEEVKDARELLMAALEPVMMLLVGAVVSVFVVSLMVPLMSIGQR